MRMFIIWWIIVGLIAGFLTGKLMKGSGYGAIGDIVIGIIGAIVGGFIMQKLGYAGSGGLIYTVIGAIVGAVLLPLLLRLVTGNRARNLEPSRRRWRRRWHSTAPTSRLGDVGVFAWIPTVLSPPKDVSP